MGSGVWRGLVRGGVEFGGGEVFGKQHGLKGRYRSQTTKEMANIEKKLADAHRLCSVICRLKSNGQMRSPTEGYYCTLMGPMHK